MIVSWNWLKDYVDLDMDPDELVERLSMSGLNHEGTDRLADDVAIDLEVTSNRPDCLGHIGVAREISVLWDQPLRIPDAQPQTGSVAASDLVRVSIDCPLLCRRYTARVIRGVKVGSSPSWLVDRLAAVGIAAVNNVVDLTNYVMLECGQPLHAFDLACVEQGQIIVREPKQGEQLEAIDHRTYPLEAGMCVIADARRPVAIGGVMGGAESEVSETTSDLLIEAAEFAPLPIRTAARRLNLHSPSSYRFERSIDPEGVDWASRRVCQLILELAGGELADGVVDVGSRRETRKAITLRMDQLRRILGISIPVETAHRVLVALGGQQAQLRKDQVAVVPPSWRRDLTREIDLIEEVARIHGYQRIPEDVAVPMTASHRSDRDRQLATTREVMTASGFDEAMTASVVPIEWAGAVGTWSQAEPLRTETPLLRGADAMRQSLIPSLLEARRLNQSLGNDDVELFETAHIYLPQSSGLPLERSVLGMVSGGSFARVKGVIESLLAALKVEVEPTIETIDLPFFASGRGVRWKLGEQLAGFMGEISAATIQQFGLRGPAAVAELDMVVLEPVTQLVPQYQPLSPYPAVTRDLNLIVNEQVRWSELADSVRSAAGDWLETLDFLELYRDAKKDGAGKKRLLFTMTFRSTERTLTGSEVDERRDAVVARCRQDHQAVLLA